jgi:hypothetical protein
MSNHDDISDEELERLFQASDHIFAVQMLDAYRREHMWRYIKSIYRSFKEEDLHDIYVKALEEFIECVKKPDFNPKAPIRLLKHISHKRAIDRMRSKYRARSITASDLIEPLAVDLKDSRAQMQWRLMFDEQKASFRRALDRAVDNLAPKQRTAAVAMLEVYDEIRSDESPKALAARIREMTGEDCTASQAADRWEAALENLRSAMTRAGFKHLFEDLP